MEKRNSMKLSFLVIILIAISSLLFSQFDELKILEKKADNLTQRRQFEKANEVYLELLNKFPEEFGVLEKLIINYLRTAKLKEAETILEKHKNICPESDYLSLKIQILLRNGKIKQSYEMVQDFLSKNSGNINYYSKFSLIFQQAKQDKYALKILQKARDLTKDDFLFALEMANSYQNMEQFPEAVEEFLKHLEKNNDYFHYVLNKLQKILFQDKSQIKAIENYVAQKKENEHLIEIYALCLAEIGNLEQALMEYDRLENERLIEFADRFFSTGDYETAQKAYKKLLLKLEDPLFIADVKIRIAEIYMYQNNLISAKNILLQVYDDKKIQAKKYRFHTKANRYCRELLATIAIRQDEDKEIILQFMKEAKEFAYNQKEKKEIDFQIIHFMIMSEMFEESKIAVNEVLENEDPSSDIYKLGFYYSFLIATMENNPEADSLLGELVINLPESYLTNDALQLTILITNFSEDVKSEFLSAYRKKLLFKYDEALKILSKLFEDSKQEEILILIGEWALENNDQEKAKAAFSYKYESEVINEYAQLKLASLTKEKIKREKFITDFLKMNPQSVFSPEFRHLLEKTAGI